jgi:4-amino-4-deoxy-L-arabinose transferase-like glycosyltransferase
MVNSTAKSSRVDALPILIALLVGLSWKSFLLVKDAFPFNADEAIVGLMAGDILAGARPIYFYGQAYMGALDAYLVALGFQVFGEAIWVIRLVQILLYGGVLYTSMRIATLVNQKRSAILATGLLLAIPTINFTLYTTVSLGGYGEVLLLGNLLILITLRSFRKSTRSLAILWGFIAGLGFWAFGLMLIYILSCVILLFKDYQRTYANRDTWFLLLLGFFLGSLPFWIWVLQFGLSSAINELFGSAIAGSSSSNPLLAIFLHSRNLLLFGPTVILGFRPPWSVEPLGLALLPFAVIFWFCVLLHTILRRQSLPESSVLKLLAGVVVLLVLGFTLTPFGSDPSGRYFLPIMIPLAILGGEFIASSTIKMRAGIRWTLLVGVVAFNGLATLQAANSTDGITTQFDVVARVDHSNMGELIRFLTSEGETTGYTNYWVAYPLAFHSREELIFYPALPYHLDFRFTDRDNRIPEYQSWVEESEKVAFITTNHPELDQQIRDGLHAQEIRWQEQKIGDYQIFYDLSERVLFEQLQHRWKSQ